MGMKKLFFKKEEVCGLSFIVYSFLVSSPQVCFLIFLNSFTEKQRKTINHKP